MEEQGYDAEEEKPEDNMLQKFVDYVKVRAKWPQSIESARFIIIVPLLF